MNKSNNLSKGYENFNLFYFPHSSIKPGFLSGLKKNVYLAYISKSKMHRCKNQVIMKYAVKMLI